MGKAYQEPRPKNNCGACRASEGHFHMMECDMEICPFCKGQLASCNCAWKLLHVPESQELTEGQEREWRRLLRKKGRIPFVLFPIICAKCGRNWPTLFMDASWPKVMGKYKEVVLCKRCYAEIMMEHIKPDDIDFPKSICLSCGVRNPPKGGSPKGYWWKVYTFKGNTFKGNLAPSTRLVLCVRCHGQIEKLLDKGPYREPESVRPCHQT